MLATSGIRTWRVGGGAEARWMARSKSRRPASTARAAEYRCSASRRASGDDHVVGAYLGMPEFGQETRTEPHQVLSAVLDTTRAYRQGPFRNPHRGHAPLMAAPSTRASESPLPAPPRLEPLTTRACTP